MISRDVWVKSPNVVELVPRKVVDIPSMEGTLAFEFETPRTALTRGLVIDWWHR
jgi:hypothetical protein